jgi:hypothetical protein
MTYGALQVAAC